MVITSTKLSKLVRSTCFCVLLHSVYRDISNGHTHTLINFKRGLPILKGHLSLLPGMIITTTTTTTKAAGITNILLSECLSCVLLFTSPIPFLPLNLFHELCFHFAYICLTTLLQYVICSNIFILFS